MKYFWVKLRWVFVLVGLLLAGLLAGWLAGGGQVNWALSRLAFWRQPPRPGSCLILPEKYCKTGEIARTKDGKPVLIGFQLPPGTPVFTPFAGTLSMPSIPLDHEGQSAIYPGLAIYSDEVVFDLGHDRPLLSFTMVLPDQSVAARLSPKPLAKGELIIATTRADTRLLGKYDLLVYFGRANTDIKMFENDFDNIKDMFAL